MLTLNGCLQSGGACLSHETACPYCDLYDWYQGNGCGLNFLSSAKALRGGKRGILPFYLYDPYLLFSPLVKE